MRSSDLVDTESVRRAVAVLFSLVIVGVSLIGAYLGIVFGFALQCDDSCGQGGGWRHDPHAWQWQLLGWSGLVCLGLAFTLLVATRRAEAGSPPSPFSAGAFAVTFLVLIASY